MVKKLQNSVMNGSCLVVLYDTYVDMYDLFQSAMYDRENFASPYGSASTASAKLLSLTRTPTRPIARSYTPPSPSDHPLSKVI